jgi:hypothetical protein
MSLDINLTGVEKTSNKKTTLTDNSDTFYPTQKAVKTAVDAKENTITAGTTAQYFRGDKTFQTLDKTAVGLSNVDNTSDANKPVSTDTQTALNAKFNNPTGTTAQYLRGDGTVATFPTIPSVTGLVPYTGATSDVNLGTFHLDAAKGTFTHNGSTDTLTSNHTSGSGIGLLITKGGNNEGLKVNKTSGSGNAATIIGTLEATTLVKTGGTSSQFLMADGSTNTAVVPTTRTINGYDLSANRTLTASDVGAVATNSAITGATKTKITYDAKGLVTNGADATTADIADSTNKRYQTDNQQSFNDATSSIQTQLDAKQSKLLVKKLGASATIATTVESIIGNVEILGGTLASTDYLNIKSRAKKTGAIGTYLLRYYLNTTSNSLTGATQIAISGTQTTTSIISASFERDFTIDGGNLIGFPFATASNDGTASASTVSSVAYTVATTYYIITTITLVSALDTASLIGQKITNF